MMHKISLALLALFLVTILPGVATAGMIYLPKTGQTSIESPGDDGDKAAGVEWPTPRFIDNGDGTIKDNLTGLTWLKDTNCIWSKYPGFDTEATAGDGMVSWKKALEFAAGMNDGTYANCAAGKMDWRLPNINELGSLVHFGTMDSSTWLKGQGFTNLHPWDNFWSSTTDADSTASAWVYALEGLSASILKTSANYLVWPVRGTTAAPAEVWKTGQTKCYDESGGLCTCGDTSSVPPCPEGQDGDIQAGISVTGNRFTDNGDGTVTDNLTNLVWLKDAGCIYSEYPGFDWDANSEDGRVTWQHALDFIAGINNGTYPKCGAGKTDWRLPNLKELRSLTDLSTHHPALTSGHPFKNVNTSTEYWSSTTCNPSNKSCAKAVLLSWQGADTDIGKSSDLDVWPVRGGCLDTVDMPLPSGPNLYYYPSTARPHKCADPNIARFLGTGEVAVCGCSVSLIIETCSFSGLVDVYLAFYWPAIDPFNVYLLKSDNTFQVLSKGWAPWKVNAMGPISESLFGTLPIIWFPSGTYYIFVIVAPAGILTAYYIWGTNFIVP